MFQPIITVPLNRTASARSDSQNALKSEAAGDPVCRSHDEQYLVVRLIATVYQREPIKVIRGPHPLAVIGPNRCVVVHPRAYDKGGVLTPECRSFLVIAVQNAVERTRFRMCLVWSSSSCTFVELDRSVKDSSEPPSGGFPLPFKIAFDERIPLDHDRGEA